MKKTIILLFIFASINAFAQTETLTKEEFLKEIQPLKSSIQSLQNENDKLKNKVLALKNQLSITDKTIESLQAQTQANSNAISQTANELGIKIKETIDKNENKITEVQDSLSKNSLYGIIGVLSAILLSGTLYWRLNKRQKFDKTNIIKQLSQTKSSIEESLVKLFEKQTELMETQLQLIKQQKNKAPTATNQEPDHSLALKVANEINLIERNLSLMDANIKGYKQLKKSVEKLKDNLDANGYEIIDLQGKTYHPGLPVTIINSYPDENLDKNQEIISKILIPAVRFNNKLIQSAQVEVNIGV